VPAEAEEDEDFAHFFPFFLNDWVTLLPVLKIRTPGMMATMKETMKETMKLSIFISLPRFRLGSVWCGVLVGPCFVQLFMVSQN